MIVLFGPAGSGKSTQGQKLASARGWKWLSVGQVLRDTGEFAETLKTGNLVDDATVVRLMNEQIEKAQNEGLKIVLDGYPRDIEQTEIMLSDSESKFFSDLKLAIILDVPREELWKRIEARQREDDTREALERRFAIFEQNICSIMPLLEEKGIRVEVIDGVGTEEEVFERINTQINRVM